ncbi:tetratricopeptide repeat protein [Flavisolibacter ginsenosidimutans]|uniref:Tetratricopeptide repeat protein n=1 Tax=Flavisolibacter ginsenosidimutans TaxID=661481 RepID=A0A5B8UIK5_9BACT|nr:tetratricopeptide repeat protein [Flavisolibacter ginsenosidimutans]QEC56009.1 tetratricopeptide repeat protein [Flavisolibacter ginsenosidimutans]
MKAYPQEDKDGIDELLKLYNNLRNGHGSFIEEEAFEKIIDYYDEKEEISKALEAAETALEYFPYSSLLLIKKADLLLATRKYHQALETLEKAELFDAKDINLFILKTDVYLALDRQEEAVELLQTAIQNFEGEEKIELLFELADVYDDYEEFDKVFDCLNVILEEEPTNEEALYKICFWTDFTGRNEESIRLHLKIIDEHPFNELAWFNLAAAYQGLKLYEKAIDAYQYAIAIDEKFDYAYRNVGDAYIRIRKYKEAIEALEKVLELSKPEEVIYEAIGHCYDRMHNYAQARFHYRKASHLNAEDSKLYYKIACTYFNEGQWASAAKQLEAALKIHRNQHEYNLLMGECLLQMEETREAVQFLSTAVRVRPRNISGWEALIRCLYLAEYYPEARQQTLSALKHTGGKPVFFYYLSAVLFALNKPKEALLFLEKGLTASPKGVKKLVQLNPAMLQKAQVVDMIARYKRNR